MKTRYGIIVLACALALMATSSVPADEKMPPEKIVPRDRSKLGKSVTKWEATPKREQQSTSNEKTSKVTAKSPGLKKRDECAGEWTRAVASINDPEYQNMLVIRNASNLADAIRRAHNCRTDVQDVTYFEEGARLACAPYMACDG